ncbi:c-type cytochrome [Henriciella marina]|uniref:c-type cytochrome n=1 Tax=Henriciella marina TaxID=453851 RepID=UPI0003655463|nr:c-type cytochrome [Henriciella marina]
MDSRAEADQDGEQWQKRRDERMMTGWRTMVFLAVGFWPVAACGTGEEMTSPTLAAPERVDAARVDTASVSAPESELVGQGEAIAESLCAGCHAIGLTGESAHHEAMPFRQISWHYPVEVLAEPLAEGIMVAHPEMPQWQFEPQQIDALLAYLETVQVPEEG